MGSARGGSVGRRGRCGVSRIPCEARDGLMRAWLEILRERHPGSSWVLAEPERGEPAPATVGSADGEPADAVTAAA
jgi:hypothetical protein